MYDVAFILCFMAWLHLFCGVSHAKCCQAIQFLLHIIRSCRELKPQITFESAIPRDIRTIMKVLQINPQVEDYVCCIKCYLLYNLETAPSECGYKITQESEICGEDLFSPTQLPSLNQVPRASENPKKSHIQKPHFTNPTSIFVMII